MKILALLAAVAATGLSGGAFAQTCPGSGFTTSFTAFAGKTVCVGTSPNWEAQEMHITGGALKDYKRGTDPVDPTTEIGSWVVAGDIVTYKYGSTQYSYKAYVNATLDNVKDGTGITFCPSGSGTETTGTLRLAPGPC